MSSAGDLTRRVHDAVRVLDDEDGRTDESVERLSIAHGVILDNVAALAAMVDDALNRHQRLTYHRCRCGQPFPCEERVALDRSAQEAQP